MVTDVAKYGNFAGTAAVPRCHSLSVDSHRSISLRVGGILVDPASSHMLVSKIKPCTGSGESGFDSGEGA